MRFGLTGTFSCSYLPERQEQLLVFAETNDNLASRYGQLIQVGFRRSGDQIYRPHCPQCHACHSVRVPAAEFSPSRSQKRLLKKNSHFTTRLSIRPSVQYYPLYEDYITQRHADGSMFPPSKSQFSSFISCHWNPPIYLEAYEGEKLIAVAVTDLLTLPDGSESFSALYTFYAPDKEKCSLGTWMILQQLQHAKDSKRQFLYLGYQIDDCGKMNYKTRFNPHERFFDNNWQKNTLKCR